MEVGQGPNTSFQDPASSTLQVRVTVMCSAGNLKLGFYGGLQ
jgi:hypothetical protein